MRDHENSKTLKYILHSDRDSLKCQGHKFIAKINEETGLNWLHDHDTENKKTNTDTWTASLFGEFQSVTV